MRDHIFFASKETIIFRSIAFSKKNNFKKINKIILIFFRKRWFLWHTKTITVYLLGNSFFQFLNVLIRSFFCYFFIFFIIEVYASYIMALEGVKLETLISQPDALTTSPPSINVTFKNSPAISFNLLAFLTSFFIF